MPTRNGYRDVWRIAAPLILSNVTVPLLGIVDTAVVGHLDSPVYLGAVAVGSVIFSFLFVGLNFLRMGTTGVTAQAAGNRDGAELRGVLASAAGMALVLGMLLIVVRQPVGAIALGLLEPDADVEPWARAYYGLRIWAAPAVLANFAVVGWFIGLGNGRAPLTLVVFVNSVNVALDLLFVVRLGMHVEGVALASVIAEFSGLGLGAWLVARELRRRPADWRGARLFTAARMRRLVAINANLFVRTMALMFAFGFFTAQSARQGGLILAANAVLLNLQYFMAYALDGFANAAEALVGRAIGSGSRSGFRDAVRVSMRWSAFVALAFVAAYALAGRAIVGLMTDIEGVRTTAYQFLPWLMLSPLVSTWSFVYDGVYVGATRAREMRDAMLFSTLLVYLPAWYLLRGLGNHGLWLSFLIFMAARGLSMHWLAARIERREGFVKAAADTDPGR